MRVPKSPCWTLYSVFFCVVFHPHGFTLKIESGWHLRKELEHKSNVFGRFQKLLYSAQETSCASASQNYNNSKVFIFRRHFVGQLLILTVLVCLSYVVIMENPSDSFAVSVKTHNYSYMLLQCNRSFHNICFFIIFSFIFCSDD